jgi:hypothetical protein
MPLPFPDRSRTRPLLHHALALALAIAPGDARARAVAWRSEADATASLARDAAVNSPNPAFCGCNGLPVTQSTTAIAAMGSNVLVSYYDGSYRCRGSGLFPRQGHGYSRDHGATFRDGHLLAGPSSAEVFAGSPGIAVNRRSGQFYVCGLRWTSGTYSATGVLVLLGHFTPDSFAIDRRVQVAVPAGNDYFQDPRVAADSASGMVYVAWASYSGDGHDDVMLRRYDASLDALGAAQVAYTYPNAIEAAVAPVPVVGPDGGLTIVWAQDPQPFSSEPTTLFAIHSSDLGLTFGPVNTVASFDANTLSSAAGSLRTPGYTIPSVAVDLSSGPHRGRIYVAWDECLHYQDAPFSDTTSAFEVENNGYFANATPFVPGGKLRGSMGSGDTDLWGFDAQAGQTLVVRADTLFAYGANFGMRVMCDSDTSTLSRFHRLAYGFGFAGILCSFPTAGHYYLVFDGGGIPTDYALSTALLPPASGARARDSRDQMVAHSDDGGATWSVPVRLNDDAPGFDGCYPALAVDGRGRVHASFFSFQGVGCGDVSDQVLTSSADGGDHWGATQRVTDVSSFWSPLGSCYASNQGDYEGLAADGDWVYAAFTDARNGNPDVFVDASRHESSAAGPGGTFIRAGRDTIVGYTISNDGNYPTPIAWTISDTRHWIIGASPDFSGTQLLDPEGGSLHVAATLSPPFTCVNDSTIVTFVESDPAIPGEADTVRSVWTCARPHPRPAPYVLSLFVGPHPATREAHVHYTLTHDGHVRLELADVRGARVRTLEAGTRTAGPHEVVWDGRDELGNASRAGVYFIRFEAEGETMRRPLVLR